MGIRQGDDNTESVTKHTKYRPLREIRETLRVKWYRCPVGPGKLSELSERSDVAGFRQAGGHLAVWCFTAFATWHYFALGQLGRMMMMLWVHGMIGSCFLFGCHELGHGTVFRTKWLNRLFLYTMSLLSWWDPFDYAMSHTFHHKYTQFVEADRENVFPIDPTLSWSVLLEWFTINLTATPGRVFGKGGLVSHVYLFVRAALGLPPGPPAGCPQNEWLISLHEDSPKEHRRSILWSRFMLVFHAIVMLFSVSRGLWILPAIVSFHSFIGNWMRNFWGMTQHCGLRGDVPDFRKSTRTITLGPISQFFYWHMNYHIEHHMFANVPCYNLEALHKAVADDMPVPRTLVGAWREMVDAFERQQHEPDYQYVA